MEKASARARGPFRGGYAAVEPERRVRRRHTDDSSAQNGQSSRRGRVIVKRKFRLRSLTGPSELRCPERCPLRPRNAEKVRRRKMPR